MYWVGTSDRHRSEHPREIGSSGICYATLAEHGVIAVPLPSASHPPSPEGRDCVGMRLINPGVGTRAMHII